MKLYINLLILLFIFSCKTENSDQEKVESTKITEEVKKDVSSINTDLFERFTTQDAKRYCNCLGGYTRYMEDHFWHQQKYDVDSEANTIAVENSMIVLSNNSICIAETSNQEDQIYKWEYVDTLTDEEKDKYNQRFLSKFSQFCEQTSTIFLSMYANMLPTDRYGVVNDTTQKAPVMDLNNFK